VSETIHSYPWYVADWQRSETRFRLSLEGRAIYRELLDYCWQNGSLPSDEKHLAKIADCTVAQLKKHWAVFGKVFILNGDRYENERVNEGRPRLQKWHDTRKRAGAIGGKKRADNQAHAQAYALAHAQAEESQACAQAVLKPSPSPSSSSPSTTTASLRAAAVVVARAEFEPFGDEPDPAQLVAETVEAVARFWPRPGNVPLAKSVWATEASTCVGGVNAWCGATRRTAELHAPAHLEALRRNPRHFVPDLVRWVVDGDFRRPAPLLVEQETQQRRPRFDPASLEEPA